MKRTHHRRLGFESLEARAVAVGFKLPILFGPFFVDLVGTTTGTATVRPSHQATGTGLQIHTSGRLRSLGRSGVSGILHADGDVLQGTLFVHSVQNSDTIRLSGPLTAPVAGAPVTYAYDVIQGRGIPNGNGTIYLSEIGTGTVDVTYTPGLARSPIVFNFH